ncbi:DeoR/GlpR family DNA-binding transcription regulator [Eubacterium sp. ER2]|uniref:DeoR/GlpR family DNA-binding transcription regulator n=1 Tax=Eubacterium sp. ER2 TaxID=1519438 RepID=UPI00051B1F59|nr:DeoR/GlpR family DNA-binding transcription regulator [Eubacterium sp. ER2]
MKSSTRQSLMYDYIKKHKEVSVNHIAKYFNISPATVRRYLDKLEKNGLICRKYGKAIVSDFSKEELSFQSRSLRNQEYKHRIARLTQPYLKSVSSIFVDASTTTLEALKLLPKSQTLTIYTSNSAIFHYLQDYPNVHLFVLGGYLSKTDGVSLDSEITLNIARQIYVDSAFISCSGFTHEGFFETATTGIEVKRVMLQNSSHNYLLADHTKFNMTGVFQVDDWDPIHTLICDSSFDPKAEHLLKSKGISVIY